MNDQQKSDLALASKNAPPANNPGARKKGTKPTGTVVSAKTAPDVKAKAVKAATKGKKVSASSAAALATTRTKKNAETTAQPGVIASIMSTLSEAKSSKVMLTVEEIVSKLTTLHPERPALGMTTTVRAQLSRLPNEKEFAIKKIRDGRIVRYAAQ